MCVIVTNNKTNNAVMMRELKPLKWPQFKGKAQLIFCFAHILNLVANAILQPFGAQKSRRNPKDRGTGFVASKDEFLEYYCAKGQIRS